MRSKTSFFNKSIYKKNMALYWPIPVLYLFYGLIKLPGSLWSGLRQSANSGNDTLTTLFSSLSMGKDLYVLAAVAIVVGMAMFGYLFSGKSANMIHALPVTRTQLYVTNVVSGLTCILVPQLLVFLVSVVFCLLRGITCVQYLGLWLFGMVTAGFFFYSLVCFCAMMTGLLAAFPVFFLLINYLSVSVVLGIQYVLSALGYGLSFSGVKAHSVGYLMSPLAYMTNLVGFRVDYVVSDSGQTTVSSVSFEGGGVLLVYAAVALLFYGLAWYCYQRRKIEHTGDLLTFGWVRPVFRWGFGTAAGFFTGILISNFLGNVSVWIPVPVILLLILVTGVMGFYIADMLIQKTFRVFDLRRLKECGGFALLVCACFAALYGVGYYEEQYIPQADEVQSAYVYMNYPAEFQGTDVKQVIKLHKEILSGKKEFQSAGRQQEYDSGLILTYCLKDGSVLSRSYRIPSDTELSAGLADEVFACEASPDSFMKYVVGYDYDEVSQMEDAQVVCRTQNQNYVTLSMDEEIARKMYAAVCRDVEERNIQKYNLENYIIDAAGTTSRYEYAYLMIYFNHTRSDWTDVYSRYQKATDTGTSGPSDNYEPAADVSGSLYLKFGADCENILKTLVENGVISSEDDIIFSADGETTMG